MADTLKDKGHRFVYRLGGWSYTDFEWVHPLEMHPTDVDCTDMNDLEFEAFVESVDPYPIT